MTSTLSRRWRTVVAVVVTVWLDATLAFAGISDPPETFPVGDEHDPTHHGIEWITNPFPMFLAPEEDQIGLLWLFLNFAVLMYLLERLLFRPLRRRTRERHATIRDELAKATTARETAEGLMAELQGQLNQLDDERERLMQAARARAEADRKDIIEQARGEAARIRESAKLAAEREAEAHLREIENEIVDQAIQRAEILVKERLSGQDQQRLIERHLDDVSRADLGRGGP